MCVSDHLRKQYPHIPKALFLFKNVLLCLSSFLSLKRPLGNFSSSAESYVSLRSHLEIIVDKEGTDSMSGQKSKF